MRQSFAALVVVAALPLACVAGRVGGNDVDGGEGGRARGGPDWRRRRRIPAPWAPAARSGPAPPAAPSPTARATRRRRRGGCACSPAPSTPARWPTSSGSRRPAIDNLPVESVVDGFDNNAGAAAVTSRHLDEYLSTARGLAARPSPRTGASSIPCQAGAAAAATAPSSTPSAGAPSAAPSPTPRSPALPRPLRPGRDRRPLRQGGGAGHPRHARLADLPLPLGGGGEGGRRHLSAHRLRGGDRPLLPASGRPPPTTRCSRPRARARSIAPRGSRPRPPACSPTRAAARPSPPSSASGWGPTASSSPNKDAAVYPAFTDAVRNAMVAEGDAFVASVVFDGPGTFADLFTADYVLQRRLLAAFYGLPAGGRARPARRPRVQRAPRRPAHPRRACWGCSRHSNETSPVRRGAFVRERLLCETLAPPPQNLNIMPPGLDPSLTTRARASPATREPLCAACHKLIDPSASASSATTAWAPTASARPASPSTRAARCVALEASTTQPMAKFDGPLALGPSSPAAPTPRPASPGSCSASPAAARAPVRPAPSSKLQTAFAGGLDLRHLFIELVKQRSFVTRM